MAAYRVFFKKSVKRDLSVLPKKDLKKVLYKIESLGVDPRPKGCEKLSGQEKYRVRQGRYRIIYSIQDYELTVWIVKVAHRREVTGSSL